MLEIFENDFHCSAVDDDTVVITITDKKYLLDYSTLMDFLTHVAIAAKRVEEMKAKNPDNQILSERLH